VSQEIEPKIVGIVPAAGASKRMGRPKALLELRGATFARRVVRALAGGGCAVVYFVTAEHDEDTSRIARDAGAVVLTNPDPGEGPITSLRLALQHLDSSVEAAVYLPLDYALIEAEHVALLLAVAAREHADLALPMVGGKRGHPAYFGRALFRELADPELAGGARSVVHRHLGRACLVQSEDPAFVTDIDTPAAYEEAVRLDAGSRGARLGTAHE